MIMSHDVEILHVDDDPQFVDLTKTCLEREVEWFSVTTATSVEEGHEILDTQDIHCIVSDYDMPGSTGIEFLTQVRECHTDLPFILYTGKGSEEVASDAITAGVTDYLQKGSGTSQYTILANRIENAVAQRRAEAEVEQTRQQLAEVTENVTDCIWLFDRDWEEILFVSGYEQVYNRPVENLEQNPRDFLSVTKEEDRPLVRQQMAELSSGEKIDVEYRLADEDPTWVWVKGSPITDEDGTVVRVAGFSRDVTERKAQEREFERLSERYQAYVENTKDIITVLTEGGEIAYQSQAVEDVLGYGVDELVGENVLEYVHPEDHEVVQRSFRELTSKTDAAPVKIVFRFEHADGSSVWLESLGSKHVGGDIDGYLINSRDITDRKEYEDRLQTQNEQLDEFAGVVSHDLRNPLNTATARLDLAQEECDTDHHEPIGRALNRMERIIDDVLWLARNGREIGETEPVSVDTLAESAWEFVSDRSEDTLSVTGQTTRRLVADRDRLDHLFENLFANAVEHAGPGVTVRVEITDDGFAVTDDGPGIPADNRTNVFDSGYSTSADGLGVGLRIVEQVVEAHDWDITLTESEAGGARFEVTGVETRSP
jgi:PAS domain S-box-containing protein